MGLALRQVCAWTAFVSFLGLACAIPFFLKDGDAVAPSQTVKRFRQQISADFKLSRHELYGVNLVECGKCSIKKLKRGPFTFGGFNVLVLEDLKIVLPPVSNRVDAAEGSGGRRKAEPVRDILDGLGVNETVWSDRGIGNGFSGLQIKGLEVSRYEDNKVVGLFRARLGEAKSDGLHLTDCNIICRQNALVSHAVLKMKPELHLEWPRGTLAIGSVK